MRRALAAAALLALALVGCTDDGQSPTSTTSSPPPTGQTTTPTSTTSDPADEPPALPDAAKSQTTAGAKAFVRHYADVLNYAYSELRCAAAREPGLLVLQVCHALGQDRQGMAANGGSQDGGAWTVLEVAPTTPAPLQRSVVATNPNRAWVNSQTSESEPTDIKSPNGLQRVRVDLEWPSGESQDVRPRHERLVAHPVVGRLAWAAPVTARATIPARQRPATPRQSWNATSTIDA